MALPDKQAFATKTNQLFDQHTFERMLSTIDFFLNFDQKTVDQIWEKLIRGYALWLHERKNNPVEDAFRTRKSLFSTPDDQKMPWDYGDYRANSPIKLLNHLWSIGHYREPYLIFSLKAFAILISVKGNNSAWREQILQEVLFLQYFEKEIYKTGNQNFREAKSKQRIGLDRHKFSQDYKKNILKNTVHTHATELLKIRKPKSDIVGLIVKMGVKNIENTKTLSSRQIRRYLEDHESALWKPRKQKN